MNNDSNITTKPGAIAGASTALAVFSWPLARQLAVWCEAAYCPGPFNGDHPTVIQDPKTDAQAIVAMVPAVGGIIVAFKGSSRPRDFVQDAKFEMTELVWSQYDLPARVHRGFLEDFEAIDVAVVLAVKDLLQKFPAAKIFVTGHSLGGAGTILSALEFHRQKLPVAGVYTFGQPRVGNKTFCDIYDAALRDITFRLVNQNDLVPRLPGVLAGYRHCGQEIFLPVGGGWCENPALWEKVLSDVLGLYGAYRNKQDVLIKNHFIAAYQQRIQLLA